jgi:hypothetical protein
MNESILLLNVIVCEVKVRDQVPGSGWRDSGKRSVLPQRTVTVTEELSTGSYKATFRNVSNDGGKADGFRDDEGFGRGSTVGRGLNFDRVFLRGVSSQDGGKGAANGFSMFKEITRKSIEKVPSQTSVQRIEELPRRDS